MAAWPGGDGHLSGESNEPGVTVSEKGETDGLFWLKFNDLAQNSTTAQHLADYIHAISETKKWPALVAKILMLQHLCENV